MAAFTSRPGSRRGQHAALVAVLVLTAATAGACRTTSATTPACVSTAGPATAASRPAAPPPTGLKVVEKGFTQVTNDHRDVLLGAVLENTSSLVAYRVPITFQVTDKAGRRIDHPINRKMMQEEIPVIMPGQRIGVGALATVIDDERTSQSVTAAGFTLEVGTPQWWPRQSRGHTFAEVTSHVDKVSRPSSGEPGLGLSFSTRSPYCDTLPRRGVAVLLRSSDGTLIGGILRPDGVRVADPLARVSCYPGTVGPEGFAMFTINGIPIPPAADLGRTEVYPYCDIAEPPVPSTPSTAPIN